MSVNAKVSSLNMLCLFKVTKNGYLSRMDTYLEWILISNGYLSRMDAYLEYSNMFTEFINK